MNQTEKASDRTSFYVVQSWDASEGGCWFASNMKLSHRLAKAESHRCSISISID